MTGLWSAAAATVRAIGDANIGLIGAAVAVDMLSLVLMAFRWRRLLRRFGSGASFWDTLLALAAALGAPFLYRRFSPRIAGWHPGAIGGATRALVAAVVGCSLAIWSLDVTRIMLVGRAFGVRFVPAPAAAVSLLRLASGLVPVPAGIGVVDAALVGAFIWLGLPASTAAALAIVERAIVYALGTALGAVALLLLGGSRALQRARSGAAALDSASDADRS